MQNKLIAVPAAVPVLLSLGFVETGDGHIEFPEDSPSPIQASALLEATAVAASAQRREVSTEGLSLKQKALILQEEKAIRDRENAKKAREEDLAKLEQDKLVRNRDENWKAQAAGVKGGKPIETYRGKFGEDNC